MIKTNTPWVKLFKHQIVTDINKLLCLGSQFALDIAKKTKNTFWVDVLNAWDILYNEQRIHTKEQLISTPLWYNAKLSTEVLYFPKWFKRGIITISDILDTEGTFLTIEKLKETYSLDKINQLNYIRVKVLVTKYIKKYHESELLQITKPVMPINMYLINISKKGARGYYKILEQKKFNDHKMKIKWNLDFGTTIGKETWKRTFNILHYTISNNDLKWFQMKILYRIIGTRYHLKKLGIYDEAISINDATLTKKTYFICLFNAQKLKYFGTL